MTKVTSVLALFNKTSFLKLIHRLPKQTFPKIYLNKLLPKKLPNFPIRKPQRIHILIILPIFK